MPHEGVTTIRTLEHSIDFIRNTICRFYFHNSKFDFSFKLLLKGFAKRFEAYESGNLIVVLAYVLPVPKPIDREPKMALELTPA